jgi:hypothetical protein
VDMQWVSHCPFFPQYKLADDVMLVESLRTDISRIEVYDECLAQWIPAPLTHTFTLTSECHIFVWCYGVTCCEGFSDLYMASLTPTVTEKKKQQRVSSPCNDVDAPALSHPRLGSPPLAEVDFTDCRAESMSPTPPRMDCHAMSPLPSLSSSPLWFPSTPQQSCVLTPPRMHHHSMSPSPS